MTPEQLKIGNEIDNSINKLQIHKEKVESAIESIKQHSNYSINFLINGSSKFEFEFLDYEETLEIELLKTEKKIKQLNSQFKQI